MLLVHMPLLWQTLAVLAARLGLQHRHFALCWQQIA
jgi:hypothetical protein